MKRTGKERWGYSFTSLSLNPSRLYHSIKPRSGSIMAMEAVKWITGAGEGLAGRLMIHDALYGETRVIGVKRRADCD